MKILTKISNSNGERGIRGYCIEHDEIRAIQRQSKKPKIKPPAPPVSAASFFTKPKMEISEEIARDRRSASMVNLTQIKEERGESRNWDENEKPLMRISRSNTTVRDISIKSNERKSRSNTTTARDPESGKISSRPFTEPIVLETSSMVTRLSSTEKKTHLSEKNLNTDKSINNSNNIFNKPKDDIVFGEGMVSKEDEDVKKLSNSDWATLGSDIFTFDCDEIYMYKRDVKKTVAVSLETVSINVISLLDDTTKIYPILSLTLLEKSSADPHVIKFNVRVAGSGKEVIKVKKFRFHILQDREAFVNIVKDLRNCGLLAKKVWTSLVGESNSLDFFRFKSALLSLGAVEGLIEDCFRTLPISMKAYHIIEDVKGGELEYNAFFKYFCKNPKVEPQEFLISVWNSFLALKSQRSSTLISGTISKPAFTEKGREQLSLLVEQPILLEAEQILQTCDSATLHLVGLAVHGFIFLTNYRLIFIAHKNSVLNIEMNGIVLDKVFKVVNVPLLTINKIHRDKDDEKFSIHCKNLRVVRFSLDKSAAWNSGFLRVLHSLAFPKNLLDNHSYIIMKGNPYSKNNSLINGWRIYDPLVEFRRQGVINNPLFRVFLNSYNFIPTYPHTLIVPTHITDEQLVDVVRFRSKGRIPAVTWYHKRTGCVLVRASQPLVGIIAKRCLADEYICNLYRLKGHKEEDADPSLLTNFFYLVDARSLVAAEGNRMRKGGIENKSNYTNTDLSYLNIENIHTMRDSLSKLAAACEPYSDDTSFLRNVDASGWLHHTRLLLKGAIKLAEILELQEQSVVCHCSDGWDRTAQLCALAQIILDPFFRTIEGFAVLIEKEWCSFGHKFDQRSGHGRENAGDHERSPIFFQFLDTVYQLTVQYPLSFEFNETLLLFIADSLYSCRFGTFLCNTEKERYENRIQFKTESIWSHVLSNKSTYLHNGYLLSEEPIWPNTSMKSLHVWDGYFYRFDPELLLYLNRMKVDRDQGNRIKYSIESKHSSSSSSRKEEYRRSNTLDHISMSLLRNMNEKQSSSKFSIPKHNVTVEEEKVEEKPQTWFKKDKYREYSGIIYDSAQDKLIRSRPLPPTPNFLAK